MLSLRVIRENCLLGRAAWLPAHLWCCVACALAFIVLIDFGRKLMVCFAKKNFLLVLLFLSVLEHRVLLALVDFFLIHLFDDWRWQVNVVGGVLVVY